MKMKTSIVRLVRAGNHSAGGRAFSVLEMVGVLAILAILGSMLVPAVVKRVDQAALTQETANLSAIADGYSQYVLASKSIPSHTNWASLIAVSQLAMSPNAVATNARGWARAFVVDPTLSIRGSALPYVQTANGTGTSKPLNARVMIVSSLSRALPIGSGPASSLSEFNAIWNTADGAKPTNATWSAWAGKGEDLRVKKINLEPLFHRLILVNRDAAGAGVFTIDNLTNQVPVGGTGTNTYYLDGTVLGMQSNATLMVKEIINDDMSRVFEGGYWRDEIGPIYIATNYLSSFATNAAQFVTNSAKSGLQWGGTPQQLATAMSAYMYAYTLWSSNSPCFSYTGTGNPNSADLVTYELIHEVVESFAKSGSLVP